MASTQHRSGPSALTPPLEKQQLFPGVRENLFDWPAGWWNACAPAKSEVSFQEISEDGTDTKDVSAFPSTSLPGGPKNRCIIAFTTSRKEEVYGEVLRQGPVLYLYNNALVEVTLSVHGSSFRIEAPSVDSDSDIGEDGEHQKPRSPQQLVSMMFSPFSLATNTTIPGHTGPPEVWAPFKLTIVRSEGDRHCIFVSVGTGAPSDRDQWLTAFGHGIRKVTYSLFPQHALEVRPLPGEPSTTTRLMAGYLIRCEISDTVCVFYAELHAYYQGEAKLNLYRDELCDMRIATLFLTEKMELHCCKGENCSIFAIEGCLFSARTPGERALWLRAVGNTKVKLMFEAPDPTREELTRFRAAILERIVELSGVESLHKYQPLLPVQPRAAPECLRGDDLSPEVLEEDTCSRTDSRLSFSRSLSRGLAEDQDFIHFRLARVVELMDVAERAEFLRPFDSKAHNLIDVDLDEVSKSTEKAAGRSDKLLIPQLAVGQGLQGIANPDDIRFYPSPRPSRDNILSRPSPRLSPRPGGHGARIAPGIAPQELATSLMDCVRDNDLIWQCTQRTPLVQNDIHLPRTSSRRCHGMFAEV